MNDWVATAPTPGSAHATDAPTENQCDWTATPICPLAESRATMEKVWTGRSGRGGCWAPAPVAAPRAASASVRKLVEARGRARMGILGRSLRESAGAAPRAQAAAAPGA